MDESILDTDSPVRGESAQPEDGDGQRGSSNQVRKAQNRIAQREFRLRKQQYIRDLEAKVEVLSGDKEERAELMTLLIRNLLKENKDLRGMVRAMASFIGEGLGSCLPRLGLTAAQLDAIINQTESDTAHEAFLSLKTAREAAEASANADRAGEARKRSMSTSKRKRDRDLGQRNVELDVVEFGGEGSSKGKTRALETAEEEGQAQEDEYMYLFPELERLLVPTSSPPPSAAPGPSTQPSDLTAVNTAYQPQNYGYAPNVVPDFEPKAPSMRPQFPVYAPQTAPQGYATGLPGTDMASLAGPPMSPNTMSQADYAQRHAQLFHINPGISEAERQRHMGSTLAEMTAPVSTSIVGPGLTGAELARRRREEQSLRSQVEHADLGGRRIEAMQLITYHLDNYRSNPEYILPPSLQPTTIQRTVPHEHAIDGIIFPSIRDRMIVLRGQYDLVTIFQAMLTEFRLNGDDMLDHRSYEVSEGFCRDYSMLLDDEVYTVTNKWRAMRGELALKRPDKRLEELGPGQASGLGLGPSGSI